VTLAGRSFRIARDFVEDVEGQTLEDRLARLRRALLVLHAPRDETVGIENATELFRMARHPKSFVTLDDADHLLRRPEDAAYAAGVIAAWAERYLDVPAREAPAGAPEGVVRVTEADPDGFLQDVRAGADGHLVADEPARFGGTGLGPSPYELVAAGLGACTSMTIRMYARRKEWPLEGVQVDVSHERVHAEDCADCETTSGKVDVFRRAIRLDGPLEAAQQAKLMEIADRCPVHRTLESEIRVETVEWAEAGAEGG
jgi:putative redox protein